MGPGASGDNKQPVFRKFLLEEIEHFMHLLIIGGTHSTSQFSSRSNLFESIAASKVKTRAHAYLSASSLLIFQQFGMAQPRVHLDVFKLAVYFHIKVLLARKEGKSKSVKNG